MLSLDTLLAEHNVSPVFTREHDVILLATPFSAIASSGTLTAVHLERLNQALARGFIRSACAFCNHELPAALEASSTPFLTYRVTSAEHFDVSGPSLLLTSAPNAHLALTTVLERNAVFNAESIGRVARRL